MRYSCQVARLAAASVCSLLSAAAVAQPPSAAHPAIKPDVLALIRQSTDAYSHLKSYTADVVLKTVEGGLEGKEEEKHFILALDRANRFCYRDTTDKTGTAAVCDGKLFTNFKSDRNQYMQTPAPADFKGINIVDDVQFEPIGTYLIALMLQGDALADKEIKDSLAKAAITPPILENGKKLQVVHILFGPQEEPYDLMFNEQHFLVRATLKIEAAQLKITQTETLANVKTDKPVDAAMFLYVPPANATKVDRFTAPQRANDALLSPRTSSSAPGLRLASYALPAPPPIPGLNADVVALIKESTEAYGKLKSYRHSATFRAVGTSDGKKVDQSAKFALAMVRPNKFSFKMTSKPAVAAVCDGKLFTDYRAGEYTQAAAPPDIKALMLDQDDFDPVAGSYLIADLLKDSVYTDRHLLGILLKATVHRGIKVGSSTYDALDFPMVGITFILYFNPTTHLLERGAARVPDQDLVLTETFDDVEIDKPVPDSVFTFDLPKAAKHVKKLGG